MRTSPSLTLSCLSLACTLALAGCKKESSARETTGGNPPVDNGVEIMQESVTDSSDMTQASFDQLKGMMTTQMAGPVAQLDTLKRMEAEYNDSQAKEMIAQLEKKVADLQKAIDGATFPSGAKALQTEIPTALGEANELAMKIIERLQETMKTKIPGAGG